MKAEDFIELIEQNRFDKISKNGMTLIAERFRELQSKQLTLTDVVKSLPTKEEMVTKWYNKVFKNNFKFRKVFKDIVDDAYYSGALDMHKELTK